MDPVAGDNADLEIKIISARHLWAFNFFQKLCVYAAASLTADAPLQLSKDQIQDQRTAVDAEGDNHPDWNHSMSFRLAGLPSPSDLFLKIELRHRAGIPFPDRTIGEVTVPISELLESSDAFRFVDYQIRSPNGKPNGDLRFAYKVNRIEGLKADNPVVISGYPKIEKSERLYPEPDLWEDTPAPAPAPAAPADEARPAEYQSSPPQAPIHYPTGPPPIWPPPPPPPYWGPPGFGHPPPPRPPPGHFYPPWSYQQQTDSPRNNGR